ncbi:Polyketide cyclase/dehydrase [Streptomyces sp. PVA_94-07]|uniref:SRPBCC family protein n=1 Tax=Streptomyces sp. PVA_94-07 TaxID=1225337 RepID=UPI0003C2BAFC|nr:SRPBCC family protein [Streptomyces sp. PVA_94-07]ESQ07445.1 Polyketide cyclase/dehydrase [Streptomyces sp. PVA_94-07]
MPRVLTVSGSVVVPIAPGEAYALIADPAGMGRWSPENEGAVVRGDDGAPYPGMVFDGRNRRGFVRWTTRCTVTAAEPGERFAFKVRAIGLRRPVVRGPIATWEYRFTAEPGGGTRVTETWTDDRRGWPDAATWVFDHVVTSGRSFADFQRRNIAATLSRFAERCAAPAEGPGNRR